MAVPAPETRAAFLPRERRGLGEERGLRGSPGTPTSASPRIRGSRAIAREEADGASHRRDAAAPPRTSSSGEEEAIGSLASSTERSEEKDPSLYHPAERARPCFPPPPAPFAAQGGTELRCGGSRGRQCLPTRGPATAASPRRGSPGPLGRCRHPLPGSAAVGAQGLYEDFHSIPAFPLREL